MKERTTTLERNTRETQIRLRLDLDGRGRARLDIPLGFLSHMLELLAHHARIDIEITAKGDLHIDDHHLTEDLGIVLGQALKAALGDRSGIRRYGHSLLPMDEVLVAVALDLGGRFHYGSNYRPQRERVGDLSTELVDHFFQSLASQAGLNLRFRFLEAGSNEHHRVEALFKGFARSLREALQVDASFSDQIPSTKGSLGENPDQEEGKAR